MNMVLKTRKKLDIFRRQYLQLVDVRQLSWPGSQTLKNPSVQAWLYEHLFNLDKIPSPPPERYQVRVLKLLISNIESVIDDPEEDEISDDLMSRLSLLLSSNLASELVAAQQKAFVTYTFPIASAAKGSAGDATVTLLESRSIISSSGTTGLRTWEAALHLGSFLTSEMGREIVQGKTVLELGAGTGFLSILCAKHLNVSRIVATDGDESVVDAIQTNIFLNALDSEIDPPSTKIRTAALKWGYFIDAAGFEEDFGSEAPNVLLGADVVSVIHNSFSYYAQLKKNLQTYDQSAIPSLVSTMREFLELNSQLEILIAATIRNEKTFETFLNACSGSLHISYI